VLFLCKYVLYYCHRVTQFQLTNISYHISNILTYNLVNETNLGHNLFLVRKYLSISTCFRRLWAHHQEKELCLCDTWYLLFCMGNCLVCRVHTRQSPIQNNKYQVSHKHSCISWWWAHSSSKHVQTDKYKFAKKKICAPIWFISKMYNVCYVITIRFSACLTVRLKMTEE
jgi:hypothetical protein